MLAKAKRLVSVPLLSWIIYSWQNAKDEKEHFKNTCIHIYILYIYAQTYIYINHVRYKLIIPTDLLFLPHCPVVYHVQLAICHACPATQSGRSPPRSPAAGHCPDWQTSRHHCPQQPLAPSTDCWSQWEHPGTLWEPGTTPAAPKSSGRLFLQHVF